MALRWAGAEPALAALAGWLLAVGQQPIEGYARSLSRTAGLVATRSDDGYLIFLLAVLALVWADRRTELQSLVPGAVLSLLLVLGIASAALLSDVGPWTLVGAWLSLKLWIVLLLCVLIPWRESDYHLFCRLAVWAGCVVAAFAVVDFVASGFLHTILHTKFTPNDPSQPARSHYVQSVFQSPSRFSNFMTVVFTVAVARYFSFGERRYLVASVVFGA